MLLWKEAFLTTLFIVSVNTKSVFNDAKSAVADHGPALAMVCGKVTQHRDVATGRWISVDRDCIKDRQEMLDYCKEVYPTLEITNVLEESDAVHVSSWCHLGSSPPCRGHGHNVRPVKCIEGHYEPKALNVQKGCAFEHKIDYESCHLPQYWEETATHYCITKGKTLSNPQMLKPCPEVDQWSGVQFLCCQHSDTSERETSEGKNAPAGLANRPPTVEKKNGYVNPICLQPKQIGLCRALLPAWHFNQDIGECQFFQYGGCGGNDNNFDSEDECVRTCQPGDAAFLPETHNSFCGLPPDKGMCLALFGRFYYDPADRTCKMFSYGGCGGNDNNFIMLKDCQDKCRGYVQAEPPIFFGPGPVILGDSMKPSKVEGGDTTVDPVTTTSGQFYTDKTTIDDEHDVFADMLETIKSEHQAKVDEILKKWDEDNSRMSPENLEQLDELEEDLQLTISTLEDEYDGRMEALNRHHMGRMDAMVEEERAKTLQRFLDELEAYEPKVRHVLSALKKYIAVERQDKSHTMQHYFMAVNDEFDTDSIPDFRQRLNQIDSRVNQTHAALQEHPDILKHIQDEAEEILSTMPDSPDFESDGMDEDDADLEEDVITTTKATSTAAVKYDAGGIPDPDVCLLEPDVGPCRASLPSYYYDTNAEECRVFYYGGCGGNDNNFLTMEGCMSACPGVPLQFDNVDTNGVLSSEDILPEEDEFDVAETDDPLPWDGAGKNSILSSLDGNLLENESIEGEDDEEEFDVYGGQLFKDTIKPNALVNNVNKASGASNWIIWSVLAVGLLGIAVAIVVIAMKKNKTRPPLKIVVEKPEEDDERELTSEEKQLFALQQNGYENPTYKFFEKRIA